MSLVPGASPPLAFDDVLANKYRLIRALGEGATGVVYEAECVDTKEHVAVKVIHRHLAGDSQIRGRFLREASILRRVSGPHLCTAIDFGETEAPVALLYIVLPLVDGQPLDAVLRAGPLPIDQTATIMLDVCDALAIAHLQGVVHRDLKPGNVLLQKHGRATVVDFGLAKIVAGASTTAATVLTQHNQLFGTPEYMAPEQARGDELDPRCDVYAAGIMLYELLSGVVPFSGSALSILTLHMTEDPVPPRARVPDRAIPPALEAVALHAMAKNPSQRYPTAVALANAVRQAMHAPDDVESVKPQTVDANEATLPSMRAPAAAIDRVTLPSVHLESRKKSPAWILVVAAAIGIAIGVWLSLRNKG